MLSPNIETFRLTLHVLAAAVWVGGQLAVGGIVGRVRRESPGATTLIAQGFARVAWPAFGVLMLTGMWGLMAEDFTKTSGAYQATMLLKITLAVASAVFAVVHAMGRSKASLAIGGALGLLSSIGAVFLGVLLHTGS